MSKFNKLPVAPEFIEALQDTAVTTLRKYFEKSDTPQDVVDLALGLESLGYYLTECYRNPKHLQGDPDDRFAIERIMVEVINAIANLGGEFNGSMLIGYHRKGTPLEKVEGE